MKAPPRTSLGKPFRGGFLDAAAIQGKSGCSAEVEERGRTRLSRNFETILSVHFEIVNPIPYNASDVLGFSCNDFNCS